MFPASTGVRPFDEASSSQKEPGKFPQFPKQFCNFLRVFFFLAFSNNLAPKEKPLQEPRCWFFLSSLTSSVPVENPPPVIRLDSRLVFLWQRTPWSSCPRMKPQRAPCHQRRSLSSLSLWKTAFQNELHPTGCRRGRWCPAASGLLWTGTAPREHRPR